MYVAALVVNDWAVFGVMMALVDARCCRRHEVEANPFCQSVLRARMMDGLLPKAPIESDILEFHPTGPYLESVGLTAGFPCQVFWSNQILASCFLLTGLGWIFRLRFHISQFLVAVDFWLAAC